MNPPTQSTNQEQPQAPTPNQLTINDQNRPIKIPSTQVNFSGKPVDKANAKPVRPPKDTRFKTTDVMILLDVPLVNDPY